MQNKYFEIFRVKSFFGWNLGKKFDFCFYDNLENPLNIVLYESITAEEVGQLMGGN